AVERPAVRPIETTDPWAFPKQKRKRKKKRRAVRKEPGMVEGYDLAPEQEEEEKQPPTKKATPQKKWPEAQPYGLSTEKPPPRPPRARRGPRGRPAPGRRGPAPGGAEAAPPPAAGAAGAPHPPRRGAATATAGAPAHQRRVDVSLVSAQPACLDRHLAGLRVA